MSLKLLLHVIAWASLSLAQQCTNSVSRTWNIILARPNNEDGRRIFNSVSMAVAQTSDPSNPSMYTPLDTFVFSSTAYGGSLLYVRITIFLNLSRHHVHQDDGCASTSPTTRFAAGNELGAKISSGTLTFNASFIIGASCSESTYATASILNVPKNPIISYNTKSSVLSQLDLRRSSLFANFLRVSFLGTYVARETLNFLSSYGLLQIGLLCSDDAWLSSICQSLVSQGPGLGFDIRYPGLFPSTFATSTDIANITANLKNFVSTNIRTMLPIMYNMSMYGSQYFFIVQEDFLTSDIFTQDVAVAVLQGAILLRPINQIAGFSAYQFNRDYQARYGLSDSPGYLGYYAYDAMALIANAVQQMRLNCVNLTDDSRVDFPIIMNYLRQASFVGSTGPISFLDPRVYPPPSSNGVPVYGAGASNDRKENDFIEINNMQSRSWVTVGSIQSRVIYLTQPIVFPGQQSTPPTQFFVGFLYSNSPFDPLSPAVAPAFAYTLQQLNLVANVDSPLYAAKGRQTIVSLPVHTAVDDCGVTPATTIAALTRIFTNGVKAADGTYGKSAWTFPLAMVAFECSEQLTVEVFAFIAKYAASVPFMLYGAPEFDLRDPLLYPNFLRILVPTQVEAQMVASLARSYGSTRLSLVSTSDTLGRSLYKPFATTPGGFVDTYGLRDDVATVLGVNVTLAELRAALLAGLGDVNAMLLFVDSPTSGPLDDVNMPRLIAQILYNASVTTVTRNVTSLSNVTNVTTGARVNVTTAVTTSTLNWTRQLYASGHSWDEAVQTGIPAPYNQIFQGMIWTQTQYAATAAVTNFTRNFLLAYPSITRVDLAPYIYDAIVTILQGVLRTLRFRADPYSSLMTYMRQLNLVGLTGFINYTTTSNRRVPPDGAVRAFSYRTDEQHDLIAISVASGDAVLVKNPQAFVANSSLPVIACAYGTVSTINITNGLTTRQCRPCPFGSYGAVNTEVCVNCSSSQLCPLGTSRPYSRGAVWQVNGTSTLPIASGLYVNSSALFGVYLLFIYAAVGGLLLVFTVFNVALVVQPERAKPLLARCDIFVAEHTSEPGVPITRRRTFLGGYCSFTYLFIVGLAIAFFVYIYQVNKYEVVQTQALGTLTLVNPTFFSLNVTFIAVNNMPNCPDVCTNAVLGNINGVLTCTASESTCVVSFVVSSAYQYLPYTFNFSFVYAAASAAAVHYAASGTTFNGVQSGVQDTILANSGQVLFGNTFSVVSIAVQPYVFRGAPDLPSAPSFNAGYLMIPNTK